MTPSRRPASRAPRVSRVLLVDVSDVVRSAVRSALESALGWRVVDVATADEALRWAAGHDLDLLVLDLHAADASPAWVLEAVRALHPGVPAALVGAPDDPPGCAAEPLGHTDVGGWVEAVCAAVVPPVRALGAVPRD